MKKIIIVLFMTVSCGLYAQNYSRSKTQISNEIKAHNKAVHVFNDWMRDPYITLGPDGNYYLTVTQKGDTVADRKIITDGIPLYKSKDLADWKFEGYIYTISNDATNAAEYSKELEKKNKENTTADNVKLWAPEIHFIDGKWVLLHTSSVGLGNFVSTKGNTLKRPFTAWNERFGKQHDPTIFVDDNNSKWLVSRCASIQKLNNEMTDFDGKPININPSNRKMGHEGSVIIKFEGKYIFFGTGWSTDNMRKGTYNLYYSVSDKLEGPYNERKFAGRFLGHGTPFKDKQGKWWCTAFYNANSPTLTPEETRKNDLSQSAYTLNKQGLTLVPMDIKMVNGEVVVRALDPDYAIPGTEEVQKF
jgi:xylan 1,4-beta-xylosidase